MQLLCTVRDCRLTLTRHPNRLLCPRGHSFDIARSGYVNLLQPQDRRSKYPGDSLAAVNARRRLHDAGITAPLAAAISETLSPSTTDTVLDAGCGEGFYLGTIQSQTGFQACGVDISIPAVDLAAKRYPSCEWVVANADRVLPYAGHSFSHVVSITARMNASEFRRVLRGDGRLLIALPAPDDLIELRGEGRDRAARTLESFAGGFVLESRKRITTVADLDGPAVHDVLTSIYRPRRNAAAMRVTFSLDLLLFRVSECAIVEVADESIA